MASSKEYLNFIMEQLGMADEVSSRAMMGEYVIYYRGKVIGGIYDDRFLVKDTPSARALMPNAELETPYEGGKPMLLVDNVDSREFLCGLLEALYGDLPAAKNSKKKRQKTKDALTDELIEAAAAKAYAEFERAGENYRAGLLGNVEFADKMLYAFVGGFWEPLRDSGLKLRIDCKNYPGFVKEYEAYRRGSEPTGEASWLCHGEHMASPGDRRRFFALMDKFELTPEFFAPIPDGLPRPELTGIHAWNDVESCIIEFNCEDDGGLLGDPSPVGKTFTLTDGRGIRAFLTVKEDRRGTDRNGMDLDEQVYETPSGILVLKAEFLAEGSIEGYTAEERTCDPSVLIRLRDGKVSSLSFYRNNDDIIAFNSFHLWKEYFAACDGKSAVIQSAYKRLFDRFKLPPSERKNEQ